MRVRILESVVGPRFAWRAGDELDLPPDEAKRLLKAGSAERVETTEAAAAPETTARRTRRVQPRG